MRFHQPKLINRPFKVGMASACYLDDQSATEAWRSAGVEAHVSSFRAQTHTDWLLDLTHDGPTSAAGQKVLDLVSKDARVAVTVTPERKQAYGHPWRQAAIDRLLLAGCDLIGLTNADNYHCPVYFNFLAAALFANNADMAYCDMVHSHIGWKQYLNHPTVGRIDLACFLATAAAVRRVPFASHTFIADGEFIAALAANGPSVKVDALLFVHN